MAKDVNKLLRELRQDGWWMENSGSGVKAHHPDGGFVVISRSAYGRSLENTKADVRRLDRQNAEKKRQQLFEQNTGKPPVMMTVANPARHPDWLKERFVDDGKKTEWMTHFKTEEKSNMPAKPEANDDRDSALLGLLSEMSDQQKLILGGVEAVVRRLDSLAAALQSEAARREDEALYQQRLKLLDEKLKMVPLENAAVITFTNEKDLVETSKLVHAYGQKNSKIFATTRNDLKLVVVRVK